MTAGTRKNAGADNPLRRFLLSFQPMFSRRFSVA